MPPKLTQEYVDNYIKNEGWINKSIYIDNRTKLELICPNRHEQLKKFNDFKSGYRCQICSGNKKKSILEIKKYTILDGTICISEEKDYKNNKSKLNFICPDCEFIYTCCWNNFKSDSRCPKCAGNIKYTIKEIKEFSLLDGTQCISDEEDYNNKYSKLKFICPKCFQIYKTCFDSFKNQSSRCQQCWFDFNRGKNNCNFKKDRTRRERTNSLNFNHNKLNILKDDPNYKNHIQSKKEAKLSDKLHDRSKYTVDHIFPKIAFIDNNLDKIYELKIIQKICNLRKNIRIILQEENRDKWYKYNREEFMNWFQNELIIYLMRI